MNKVILMGRLTRDPEVRYTQTNNTLVASSSIAVNRRFTRPGEERQADFINIVAWSKLGEFCSKYFKKGQQVGVIGRIQTRNWEDENKVKHYITEVVAEEVEFLTSRTSESQDVNPSDIGNQTSNSSDSNGAGTTKLTPIQDDSLPF